MARIMISRPAAKTTGRIDLFGGKKNKCFFTPKVQ